MKSLEEQTINDFEVMIVVNGNKRYFNELSSAIGNETEPSYETNLIFNPVDRGIAHSRNIALEHAKTPYIAYTDDDAIPHSSWLEELLRTLRLSKKVAAATGPVLPRWEAGAENYALWFPKELYWIIGCTPWNIEKVRAIRNGFTSNLALDRKISLQVGGFNEDFGYNPRSRMTGEDPEFGIKLVRAGYITLWNPSAVVYHRIFEERLKMKSILVRSFLEGKMKAYLSKLHGKAFLKPEANHLQSTFEGLVTRRSLKSKACLLFATMAVLGGYSAYRILDEISEPR